MIDIHTHILYAIDDGATDIDTSKNLILEAKKQGISKIFLTPHYRHGMFSFPKEKINMNYTVLKSFAQSEGIELYLGCEYHVNSEMIERFNSGRVYTLANSNYILTEYKEDIEYSFIRNHTIEAINNGYIPIIAHIERYACIVRKPELSRELHDLGALIQINADSILGLTGGPLKRFTKKILKQRLVDFVASDTHDLKYRTCHMADARKYVIKKYGEDYADLLFEKNALKILK